MHEFVKQYDRFMALFGLTETLPEYSLYPAFGIHPDRRSET